MPDDEELPSGVVEDDEPWPDSLPESGFETLRTALGANIRRTRTRQGWTQEVLAELMSGAGFDWSRVTVAQSENEIGSGGRSRRVTVEELIGLALVLRTTVLDLLGPGPIAVGDTFQSRDDLIAHLVGGPQLFTPEELTLLTRRAMVNTELRRLRREVRDLDKQLDQIRTDKKDQ